MLPDLETVCPEQDGSRRETSNAWAHRFFPHGPKCGILPKRRAMAANGLDAAAAYGDIRM